MKKQIAKGLAMLMVTLALAAASAVVANGQSKGRMVVQVPFDFVIDGKTLAAGDYRVAASDQLGQTIAIRNNAGDGALRLTSSTARSEREKSAKLVFHRYGSTYFLAQVWMAGEQTGYELPKSRQERAIERELKAIASNKTAYQVVEVAAAIQ